jgi:molybdopterin-synthase adenylyltransferase
VSALVLSPAAAVTLTHAGTVLRSDFAMLGVQGPDAKALVERVLPLLDGTRDLAAIAALLPEYSPESVASLLAALAKRGFVEAPGMGPSARFFQACSGGGRDLSAALREARVRFAGSASFVERAMSELRDAGAGEVSRFEQAGIEGASLLVAAFATGDGRAVPELAALAHERGVMSLWAELRGSLFTLGPLVAPGETACRVCASVDALHPRERPSGPAPWGAERLSGSLLALAAVEAVTGFGASRLCGRRLSEDLRTRESTLTTLVRLPWCRVCG